MSSGVDAVESTATTRGAREHARAQEGTAVAASPAVPAWVRGRAPSGVDQGHLVWAERVAGGSYTHKVLARGTHLRITDLTGDANVAVLLYNALETHERLNVADTVKVQWQVYLGEGRLLLSDQGRVLASIVDDSSGHHDTVFGTSSLARNIVRYGDGTPHGPSPAGRELFILAGAKHGLGPRDIAPCVSFFQGVRVAADGSADWLGTSGTGASVTLRLEMPAVVLLANTAHPLDPREQYSCGPIDVHAWLGQPASPAEALWTVTPEGRRAFDNTAEYLTARGMA